MQSTPARRGDRALSTGAAAGAKAGAAGVSQAGPHVTAHGYHGSPNLRDRCSEEAVVFVKEAKTWPSDR